MRKILSEQNLVVLLFFMVLVTFSLAHEDTKKMEQVNYGFSTSSFSGNPDISKVEQLELPATTITILSPAR